MGIFTAIFYQPFFNLLAFFYYLLSQIPDTPPDMGIAVIVFTVVVRILLLPTTIAAMRTKKERRDIETAVNQTKKDFPHNPTAQRQAIKKVFRQNRRILVSESINFTIQLLIFIVLYRIFTTGLLGADLHLLYDFMPTIRQPFNLFFLGHFDLTKTSLALNLFQSLTIFAVEVISLINSPFPISQRDIIRYLIILPVASFFIFMFLPAGKKLFVITTLWFSFFVILISFFHRIFSKATKQILPDEPDPALQTSPVPTPSANPPKLA